jgi:hypothetical protein
MLFASSDGKEITGLDEESEDIIPLGITVNPPAATGAGLTTATADAPPPLQGGQKPLTRKGKTMLITKTAATLSRACKNLYEEIDSINYEGKKFRKDICQAGC